MKDGNDSAVGVIADLYSATSGVFKYINTDKTDVGNVDYHVLWTNNNGSTNQHLWISDNYRWNPGTKTLKVPNIEANTIKHRDADYWRSSTTISTSAGTSALTSVDSNILAGYTNIFLMSPQYSGNNSSSYCSGYISWSAISGQIFTNKVFNTINFMIYNHNKSQKGYFRLCISGAPTAFHIYRPSTYEYYNSTASNGRHILIDQQYHVNHKFSLTFYSASTTDVGVFVSVEY